MPNLLTMAREVRLPAELLFCSTDAQDGEEITSNGEFVDLLRSRMQHIYEVARKYLETAAKRGNDNYGVTMIVNNYERVYLVWYLNEVLAVGEPPNRSPKPDIRIPRPRTI